MSSTTADDVPGVHNRFFLSRGYVTVSSGWIAEVPVTPRLLRLEAPVANDKDGVNVVGTVRAELSTDESADRLPFSNQLSYEPLASRLAEATLTRRLREKDSPQEIPRDRWRIQITKGPREEGSGLVEAEVVFTQGRAGFRARRNLRTYLRGEGLGCTRHRVCGHARPRVVPQA